MNVCLNLINAVLRMRMSSLKLDFTNNLDLIEKSDITIFLYLAFILGLALLVL